MNEELSKLANETLISLIEQSVELSEFIKGEIPVVVKELLSWHFWESSVIACFSLAFVISAPIIMKKLWNKIPEESNYTYAILGKDGDFIVPFGISIVAVFFGWIIAFFDGFIPNFLQALQITIAPRLYLLEYAINLKG